MNKSKLILFVILCICSSTQVLAQVIASDSRSKDVFNFYKTAGVTFPVTASTSSFKLNYTGKAFKSTQFYVGEPKLYNESTKSFSDSSALTVAKSYGWNATVGVGNLLTNLAKVSTFHPTFTFGIGFGHNIDKFNNVSTLKKTWGTWIWNINPYLSIDNIKLYDTMAGKASGRRHPASVGVVAELTYFTPFGGTTLWGLSGSFTYERGNNIADLKKYQDNKPKYADTNVIALGDYVGRLGNLEDKINIRGRISIPIFPKYFKVLSDTVQVGLFPYYSFYGADDSKLSHLAGIYVNAARGALYASNSTIIAGLGLGMDWQVASNGFSNYSIFVAGSLDLHNLLTPDQRASQKLRRPASKKQVKKATKNL